MDIYEIFYELKNIIPEDLIKLREPMKTHTSFNIGGPADILITPRFEEEIQKIIQFSNKKNIPLHVIGNGTNLLVKDGGIRGIVIKISHKFNDVKINGNTIICKAGVPLSTLAKCVLKHSLTGLEFAYGIPGTVGGAIVMNAGAYGGQMADVVENVKIIDPSGDICIMDKHELGFSYRESIFQKEDYIILEVQMKLELGEYDEIKRKMRDFLSRRKKKQPLELPSAGSAFKRPEGNYAGYLIEQSGLKGFRIGGASVSRQHAGFVVNDDNATGKDVIMLLDHIQNEVMRRYNILLEPEIKIVGEDIKEE